MKMAVPTQLKFGSVEIYHDQSLGEGACGKVCKARYGQLPCAAKLLHDAMLTAGDPGIYTYVERFEQECQFLSMIKHPNIVQYLGTDQNPQTHRLALLMELMDESLTSFLKRSAGPLSYHTQINICHDVALALSYLHSNAIIHRDLSSNNVLLIGEGSRAKVADFGMSKLLDINPHTSQLTVCPGAKVYMPPEALITPTHYSYKLDCFSYGVLTIQILTRNFPHPTAAHQPIEDTNIILKVPEMERRKGDIDLIEPKHPLRPLACSCLCSMDEERPSADQLCETLATLKREDRYTHSVEQVRDHASLIQTLQREVLQKDQILRQEREAMQQERNLYEHQALLMRAPQSAHKCEASLTHTPQEELQQIQALREEFEQKSKAIERERAIVQCERESLRQERMAYEHKVQDQDTIIRNLLSPGGRADRENEVAHQDETQSKEHTEQIHELRLQGHNAAPHQAKERISWKQITWRLGRLAPAHFSSSEGSTVAHGNLAYFSNECNVYSYSVNDNKWTKLSDCKCTSYTLVVIGDALTTVGGCSLGTKTPTNNLWSLTPSNHWEQVFPSMPTRLVHPAAVTTPTHLIIASEKNLVYSTVEVFDIHQEQWSACKRSLQWPQTGGLTFESGRVSQMVMCKGFLYLSRNAIVFSCSLKELLEPHDANSSLEGSSVWTRLLDLPIQHDALISVRGQVLALRSQKFVDTDTKARIYCYDKAACSWQLIGELSIRLTSILVTALPTNELVVVGRPQNKAESDSTYVIKM